jgi:hypothetical protein
VIQLEDQNKRLLHSVAQLEMQLSELQLREQRQYTPTKSILVNNSADQEKLFIKIGNLEREIDQLKHENRVQNSVYLIVIFIKDAFKTHRSHQAMIVQLESKKKELQKKVSQLESDKEIAREQFTKAIKEKMDFIDNLNTQMREMELVEISRDLIEKTPNNASSSVNMDKIMEEVQQRFLSTQINWNHEKKQLQSEIDRLRQKNLSLEELLEDSSNKADGMTGMQAIDREEESMLILEMQDRIVQSEREVYRYKALYEGNTTQLETLRVIHIVKILT